MGPEGAEVFAVDLHGGTPACGGGTAHPHGDHALRQVGGAQPGESEETQLQLKVGTYPVVERIAAKPDEALAAGVERRVRHHRAEPEHPGPPPGGGTVADRPRGAQCLQRVAVLHEADVRINAIHIPIPFEGGRHMRQRVGRREDVVGVEDPDHIACRHRDPLVDGVVHSPVALAQPAHPAAEARLILPEDGNAAVGGTAVDDDILQLHAPLPQDALNRRADRRRTVVASCYKGNFHATNH